MKKYFYGLVIFLFIGITMQSCKEDKNAPSLENQTTQQEANTASWNQVQQQLNALDMSYGLTKNIRRAPSIPENLAQVSDYTNWDFTNMGFSWGDIIAADAEGAGVGSAVGKRYGGNKGAAIGGIIVGAAYSFAAFLFSDESQGIINSANPFVYFPQANRFAIGDSAPIGSEIGELHNCMLKEMLEDENITSSMTLASMLEYLYLADYNTLSTNFTLQDLQDFQCGFAENESEIFADLGDNMSDMLSQEYPNELNIIKHYAYAVSQTTTPFDMEQYTSDFMQLVDDAYTNNQISEESAILINGTISTMYCSKTAWNYIQPDPYQCTRYILHGEDMWYLADNQSDVETIMHEDASIDFVGYPYIEDNEVKRIYVYAGLSYNLSLPDFDNVMLMLNGGAYVNSVYEGIDGLNNYYTLSLGSHLVLSATGYADYVYIDFEQ